MSSNTRDLVYLIFLIIHIPATLLVDVHALPLVQSFVPASWRVVYNIAVNDDPLLQNAGHPMFAWFQSFLLLETFFQLPVFFLGAWGLWKKRRTVYPLLALYGASTSTTTLACLATVLRMPEIKSQRRVELLATYLPFLLVPLVMSVDYGIRLTRIVRVADKGKAKAE